MQNKFTSISEAQNQMLFLDDAEGRFRFYGKGRRFGATHAATVWAMVRMLEGKSVLWGDVVYSNIDRYVNRYFIPFAKSNDIPYDWNVQRKLFKMGTGYTDFRSADKPMTWEGFGYDYIFLNEAGIILDDEYLYYNSILPMMIDNPDSILIAAGTPKIMQGKGLLFQTLFSKGEKKEEEHFARTYSTYDNPFLLIRSIETLEKQIPAYHRRQEIYGEFLESGGAVINMSWFKRYLEAPKALTITQSWDTSSKEKDINDPNVCTTWGECNDGNHYLLDVFVERMEYPRLKLKVVDMYLDWKPHTILIEDKSSGIALIQDLRDDPTINLDIVPINPVLDKVTRMATASLIIEQGKVFLPVHASWLGDYEKELKVFPNKKMKKDQVDSTSQYLNHTKEDSEIFIG